MPDEAKWRREREQFDRIIGVSEEDTSVPGRGDRWSTHRVVHQTRQLGSLEWRDETPAALCACAFWRGEDSVTR